jgi:hypothetical protein
MKFRFRSGFALPFPHMVKKFKPLIFQGIFALPREVAGCPEGWLNTNGHGAKEPAPIDEALKR